MDKILALGEVHDAVGRLSLKPERVRLILEYRKTRLLALFIVW